MESFAFILAAGIWSQWLWPILLLVIGLGLVIFVHELGHFLAAKAVGIKVERFAIGFGPRLFGFRKGETDYCVKLLPLGGYVKMLGQEDVKPLEENQADPRAFNNKSVGARFFVISAGVVMNVIFAAIFFIIVCMIGIRFQAPIIGDTVKGMPAATAKIQWQMPDGNQSAAAPKPTLQPGDEILEINGKTVDRFSQPNLEALLADPDENFSFKIKRVVDGREWIGTTNIPVASVPDGNRLGFGISPARDTVLDSTEDLIVSDNFEDGDRVVKIDGHDVEHYWDIKEIEKTLTGKPVVVTVKRGEDKNVDVTVQPALMGGHTGKVYWDRKEKKRRYGTVLSEDEKYAKLQLDDGSTEKVELYNLTNDEILDILGMVPRVQIVGVIKGSPADDAGLKPGDIIVNYAEKEGAPTLRQIHDINDEFAGEGTNITVLRDGDTLPAKWIVPKEREGGAMVGMVQQADVMHAVIAYVRPGSPAEKAELAQSDVVEKIGNTPVTTWIDVFNALKQLQDEKVTITYSRSGEQKTATIDKLDKSIFDTEKYKYVLFEPRDFKLLMGPEVKKGPLAALPWGLGETWEFILSTYASFRSLIIGTVSVEELRGPVGIGSIAIKVGRKSFVEFIYLMAMISASLAVVNFLPIPVVDGGHATFLIIEKIRGKPVPVKIMNVVQLIGLALLLFVFVAITWNDIARIVKGLW